MKNHHSDPCELREFERLLNAPGRDAAGLGKFFSADDAIWVARAPARLDVMGGIADYSGANVCEAVLGCGTLVALQSREDANISIRVIAAGVKSLPVETHIPLAWLLPGEEAVDYADIHDLCRASPLTEWVGYVAGSIFTLLKEEQVSLPHGFNLLLISSIPMNVGIGSSAAVEIGTLTCLNAYLGLHLTPGEMARFGQTAENRVVGAPCGIMDQVTIASGSRNCLTHILCRPGSIEGEVPIPAGTGFVGINSMVRHSVAGSPYTDTRIGAFMGKRMINALRARTGMPALPHLSELEPDEFNSVYAASLPESLSGSSFLKDYTSHEDPVTSIERDAVYRVRGPTRHPVEENYRVLKFIDALRTAHCGNAEGLLTAGACMYDAHASYRDNCGLSTEDVDFLVEAVRSRGAARGLYGAKITGGGTGGTVAVFGRLEALSTQVPEIIEEYAERVGTVPDVFSGTSPGAVEFGIRRYHFGGSGWQHQAGVSR